MNFETNRLNTFTNWPSPAPVDPIRIAKAGFFYTGEGTEVQCFSCGRKISQWNYGDQVMCRHRQLEPHCAFVANPQLSGNVPLILGRECPPVDTELATEAQEQPDSTEPHHYGLREEDEMYKSDALRLLSFVNWDDASISRESLVNAGFYHLGGGRLRCAWCGGELAPFRNFGSLGNPLDVHRMYFPRCAHAAALQAAQRAIHMSPPSSPSYTPPLQSPPDTTSYQPQSTGAAHNEQLLSAGGTWRSLGVVGGGAKHPGYAALAVRLATFDRWPADRTQTPRALADAGFFYSGTDDQVRCFYCDGGLGRWESDDEPWWEHAHWFPHCGFVLLVKGQRYVDSCRAGAAVQRCRSAESGLVARRRAAGVEFPVSSGQVDEHMEGRPALAALGAGLDAARVRRAIVRRMRATGMPFNSSETLIDAVLNEHLDEEEWSASPHSQRLARDILAETLRDFVPRSGFIPSSQTDSSSDGRRSHSPSPARSPAPTPHITSAPNLVRVEQPDSSNPAVGPSTARTIDCAGANSPVPEKKKLTLEEENRQLKEARLCKVCMDGEVSVVFLPCGHMVSCGGCGAALAACPLCRCAVRAFVRAYLA